MPQSSVLRSFRREESGLTGAERALLVCCGLGIVGMVGVLVRGGSGQAASDAERTLRAGAGNAGVPAATAAVGSTQMLHAAGLIEGRLQRDPPRPEPGAPGLMQPAALAAAAPPAPAPVPQGGLTLGDTASVKRAVTDKVYKHNLALSGQAKVAVTDPVMKSDLLLFQRNWERNKARYEAVAAKTGVPAKLIAALHWRESSGNFNTYLHQGDPLGKPAVHWPRNIPVFYKWEDAAVHALNMKKGIRDDLGMTDKTTDVAAMATYAEYYNGLGYYNRGRTSPYVYSGTDQYQKGKYVADGVYDPNARDRQLGVVTMVESISTGVAPPGPVVVQPPAAPAPPAAPPAAPGPPPAARPAGSPRRRAPRRHFLRRRSASARAWT